MTSTTRIYQTWDDRLDSGRLSKSHIYQFARVITPMADGYTPAGGKRTALMRDEAVILSERITANPVLLTEEHTAQGFTWLERHGRRELGLTEAEYDTIIDGFRHFSWDGSVEYRYQAFTDRVDCTPIWTIHLLDGRRFQYWFASGWRARVGSSGELWELPKAR